MATAGPQELVQALMMTIGALVFTLGLGSLLWARRPVTSLLVIDPLTIDGGELDHPKSGLAASPNAGTRALPLAGEGGLVFSSTLPEPATLTGGPFAAIVLGRAGRWGPYWQEVGRCAHRHATEGAAWDCALAEPRRADVVLGVGLAE